MEKHPRLYNEADNSVIEIKKSPFIIGRAIDCDYVIANKVISRYHCQLEKIIMPGILEIPTNGTYVNSNLIQSSVSPALKENDIIQISECEYKYKFELLNENTLLDTTTNSPITISDQTPVKSSHLNHESEIEMSSKRSKISSAPVHPTVIDLTEDSLRYSTDMPSTSNHSPIIDLNNSFQVEPQSTSDLKVKIEEVPTDISKVSTNSTGKSSTAINSGEESLDKDKSEVEDELLCAICSEMFVKASTLNCSHTFCKFCIKTWRKKQNICPICRTKITSLVPTLVLDNFIEKVVQNSSKSSQDHRKELLTDRQKLDESLKKDNGSKSRGREEEQDSTDTVDSESDVSSYLETDNSEDLEIVDWYVGSNSNSNNRGMYYGDMDPVLYVANEDIGPMVVPGDKVILDEF